MATSDRHWDEFWKDLDAFYNALNRYRAVNVNSSELRDGGRQIVQQYFRELRTELERVGVELSTLAGLDSELQELLRLVNGRNSKSSYLRILRRLRNLRHGVE